MKESDIRTTPEWLLDLVRKLGPIGLDACTTVYNPVGAGEFFAAAQLVPMDTAPVTAIGYRGFDGLVGSWGCDGLVWCNPPYSRGNLPKWTHKARQEAAGGAEVLVLTPCDIRTGWFGSMRRDAQAVCLLDRAVRFGTPEWGPKQGRAVEVSRGMALWYLGPDPLRFEDVFYDYGWVVVR